MRARAALTSLRRRALTHLRAFPLAAAARGNRVSGFHLLAIRFALRSISLSAARALSLSLSLEAGDEAACRDGIGPPRVAGPREAEREIRS